MGGLFSIPVMFIVFRETLEAAIICSVLLGVLHKTEQTHLKRYVWFGLAAGLLLTLVLLVAIVIAFNVAKDQLVSDSGEKILQGSLSIAASILIGFLALTIGDILETHDKIADRVESMVRTAEEDDETEGVPKGTIFFLAFTAVAREGVETIVFLGVGSGFQGKTIPIPLIVGAILGIVCGILLYKAGNRLALIWFFRITVILLLFIGAGIFTHGIAEIQQVAHWGDWEALVYNISACCSLRNEGWALFRAVFGYTPFPSRAEVLSYFMYWLAMIIAFALKFLKNKYNINIKELIKKRLNRGTKNENEQQENTTEEAKAENIAGAV